MEELPLEPAEADGIAASEVTLDLVAALAPAVGAVVLDDEAVLLDPATGAPHLLDAPATLVLRCLDGVSPLREIAADIADVLGLDAQAVGEDVLTLARTLGAAGLLDGVARAEVPTEHAAPTGVPEGTDLSAWGAWPEPRADRTLVVSWGTSCGFCSMIGEALAELADPLTGAGVEVLLVTSGSADALAEQLGEVHLPAVHVEAPPEFFGATGTPAAYVVDRDRVVTETLSVGAYDVPALARRLAGVEPVEQEVR